MGCYAGFWGFVIHCVTLDSWRLGIMRGGRGFVVGVFEFYFGVFWGGGFRGVCDLGVSWGLT